jgi:hypothetical protein
MNETPDNTAPIISEKISKIFCTKNRKTEIFAVLFTPTFVFLLLLPRAHKFMLLSSFLWFLPVIDGRKGVHRCTEGVRNKGRNSKARSGELAAFRADRGAAKDPGPAKERYNR